MKLNDAKKIMFDRVHLAMEEAQLRDEIRASEKQIKKLEYWVEELQMQYDDLANSGMRKFFLGLVGKREERLQEAENEVRKKNAELSSTQFELASNQSRLEEIAQTIKEIEATYNTCLDVIAESDGEAMRTKLLAVCDLPEICTDIAKQLAEVRPLFSTAYDIFSIQTTTRTTKMSSPGTYINKDSEMRRHSKLIEDGVNRIIDLLNQYNQYAPEEIKIEFHSKWMDTENYWAEQQMAHDTMDRIKKVEDWFYRVENCWKVMWKQQKEALQKLQEEMMEYLDV